MPYTTIFNILLLALVIALSIIIITRGRSQNKSMASMKKLRSEAYNEFLMSNSRKGEIVEVAKRLSDMLINSFESKYIVFLRKKRGVLDLNYYHGIRNFSRSDFHVPYNPQLDKLLKTDFSPRPVSLLENYLTPKFRNQLTQFDIDFFFPIFWRDNLYGVYFIKCNADLKSSSFKSLIAGLAQSLSAAYHIKWHESKQESLAKQTVPTEPQATSIKALTIEGEQQVSKILKLVTHRKTETIIPKIIETFKEIAGLSEMAYIYESPKSSSDDILMTNNLNGNLEIPPHKMFSNVVSSISTKAFISLDEMLELSPDSKDWLLKLKKNGLEYLASLPLAENKKGLIAWSGGENLKTVSRQLEFIKRHTADLVENAETYESIEELSYTDNLTKLSNQRYFFKRLDEEISRAARYKRKLALIIFDVDQLKLVNDTYGHLAGDALISQMGNILKKSIRTIDVIARYGGDEFCVIMPEADQETCMKFMGRLKETISKTKFKIDNVEKVLYSSISMGGAIFPDHADCSNKLIFAADMAMLKAKDTGRNKYLICTQEYTS